MSALHSHSDHGHDRGTPFEQSLDILRKAHLKITEPRKAILGALIDEHGPFTMEEIHHRMKKGACDLVTVYRCLATLEEVNLVRRCDFGDGSIRYEFSGGARHHHHHIICKVCRKVETLDICLVEGLERLVRDKGYTDVGHALEFFGICAACQKAT